MSDSLQWVTDKETQTCMEQVLGQRTSVVKNEENTADGGEENQQSNDSEHHSLVHAESSWSKCGTTQHSKIQLKTTQYNTAQ